MYFSHRTLQNIPFECKPWWTTATIFKWDVLWCEIREIHLPNILDFIISTERLIGIRHLRGKILTQSTLNMHCICISPFCQVGYQKIFAVRSVTKHIRGHSARAIASHRVYHSTAYSWMTNMYKSKGCDVIHLIDKDDIFCLVNSSIKSSKTEYFIDFWIYAKIISDFQLFLDRFALITKDNKADLLFSVQVSVRSIFKIIILENNSFYTFADYL